MDSILSEWVTGFKMGFASHLPRRGGSLVPHRNSKAQRREFLLVAGHRHAGVGYEVDVA